MKADTSPVSPMQVQRPKSLSWSARIACFIGFICAYVAFFNTANDGIHPQMIFAVNCEMIVICSMLAWMVLCRRMVDSLFPVGRILGLAALCALMIPSFFSVYWNIMTSPFSITLLLAVICFSKRRVDTDIPAA
jgi:hypothetical protein